MRKLLGVVLTLAALPLFAASDIKQGKWEYTTITKMANMPAMPKMSAEDQAAFNEAMKNMPKGVKVPGNVSMSDKGVSASFSQCVKSDNPVPQNPQQNCKMTKMDRSGSTISWAMHCDSPDGQIDSTGTGTYSGDKMTSTAKITGTSHGQPVDMTMDMTGRYIGPCK